MPSEPIKYIDRTRAFYAAQDFRPYKYAHHDSTPFHRLRKPLAECRVAIVLTAVTNGDIPKNLRGAESHAIVTWGRHQGCMLPTRCAGRGI